LNSDDLTRAADNLSRTRDVDEWRALMLVLLSHLRELSLPALVQPAFDVAVTYWDVPGGEGDLFTAKVSCYAFLKQFPSGRDLGSPDGRKVRALLCVVEPGGDVEARSMTADWFAAMLWGENERATLPCAGGIPLTH
jgi:hypothetical protein